MEQKLVNSSGAVFGATNDRRTVRELVPTLNFYIWICMEMCTKMLHSALHKNKKTFKIGNFSVKSMTEGQCEKWSPLRIFYLELKTQYVRKYSVQPHRETKKNCCIRQLLRGNSDSRTVRKLFSTGKCLICR